MFAVVRTGGKQYRVAAGDKIAVEKIPGEAGDSVTLGDVLMSGNGSDVQGAGSLSVAAEIVAQAKGEKVIVFKKRRRHNYRRKAGHRQNYTILKITAIGDHRADERPEAAATATAGTIPAAAAASASTPAPTETGTPATESAPKKSRKKADAGLVAQDAPLKVEGAESAMVDAPADAKPAVEATDSDSAAESAPAKGATSGTEA